MTARTYKLKTTFPVTFTPAGCVEQERADVAAEITYRYSPGRPATRIEPADPAEIEFVSVVVIDGDGIDLTPAQAAEYAEAWLEEDGFEEAETNAQETEAADEDDAADMRREINRDLDKIFGKDE